MEHAIYVDELTPEFIFEEHDQGFEQAPDGLVMHAVMREEADRSPRWQKRPAPQTELAKQGFGYGI
jgi:hypothetical protein